MKEIFGYHVIPYRLTDDDITKTNKLLDIRNSTEKAFVQAFFDIGFSNDFLWVIG